MTDMAEQSSGLGEGKGDGGEAPRVHKRQITAVAKMLSTLRRCDDRLSVMVILSVLSFLFRASPIPYYLCWVLLSCIVLLL